MYCVFYYVHKLSKYKKQFVYIIKEFVLHAVSPTTQRQFVYIIKEFVCVSYHTYSIIMNTKSQIINDSLCTL